MLIEIEVTGNVGQASAVVSNRVLFWEYRVFSNRVLFLEYRVFSNRVLFFRVSCLMLWHTHTVCNYISQPQLLFEHMPSPFHEYDHMLYGTRCALKSCASGLVRHVHVS